MMDPKVEAEYEEYKAAGRIWGVIDKENIKKIKFPIRKTACLTEKKTSG